MESKEKEIILSEVKATEMIGEVKIIITTKGFKIENPITIIIIIATRTITITTITTENTINFHKLKVINLAIISSRNSPSEIAQLIKMMHQKNPRKKILHSKSISNLISQEKRRSKNKTQIINPIT